MALAEQERKARRRAYCNAWRARNRARINAQQNARYAADPERHRAYQEKYRKANPEKVRAGVREWYRRNPSATNERAREYRRRNRAQIKQVYDKWVSENPQRAKLATKLCQHRRKARRLEAQDTLTPEQSEAILSVGVCTYCERQICVELDHFVPFSKGGGNVAKNIVPACKDCNRKKNGAFPLEWTFRKWGLLGVLRAGNALRRSAAIGGGA